MTPTQSPIPRTEALEAEQEADVCDGLLRSHEEVVRRCAFRLENVNIQPSRGRHKRPLFFVPGCQERGRFSRTRRGDSPSTRRIVLLNRCRSLMPTSAAIALIESVE